MDFFEDESFNDMLNMFRLIEFTTLIASSISYDRPHKDTFNTILAHQKNLISNSLKPIDSLLEVRTKDQTALSHSSLKSIKELRPIRLRDMIVNEIHHDRYLVCRTVAEPYYVYGLQTLIEDESYEIENITFYNLSTSYDIDPNDILPEGSILIIKEPHLKSMVQNPFNYHIRIDSPSDVLFAFDTSIKTKWSRSPVGFTSEELKERGNKYFINKNYNEAIECYSEAKKFSNNNNHEIYLNLSMAYLKKDQSYLAFKNAEKSISIKPTEKGYYRAGLALYKMRQYEKSWEYLEKCQTDNKVAQEQLEFAKQRVHEAKSGRYDFKKIIEDYEKGIRRHDVADYMSPNVKITDIKGKSKGIVALNDIKKGTLLVGSKAVVIAFKNECKLFLKSVNYVKRIAVGGAACLKEPRLCHEVLNNPYIAKEVYKLYAGPTYDRNKQLKDGICDVDRLEWILYYNSFAGGEFIEISDESNKFSLLDESSKSSGLWLIPSYFNHSCDFNAIRIYFGDLCLIFARRDIKKGEEISIPYTMEADFYTRSEKLEEQWNIKCGCRLCQLSRNDVNYFTKASKISREKEFLKIHLFDATRTVQKSFEKIEKIVNGRDDLKPFLFSSLCLLANHFRMKGNHIKSGDAFKKIFDLSKEQDETVAIKSIKLAIDEYLSICNTEQAENCFKDVYNAYNFPKEIILFILKRVGLNIDTFKHLI